MRTLIGGLICAIIIIAACMYADHMQNSAPKPYLITIQYQSTPTMITQKTVWIREEPAQFYLRLCACPEYKSATIIYNTEVSEDAYNTAALRGETMFICNEPFTVNK